MDKIYLDNAATTRIDDEVLDAMMPYLVDEYGNPGSIHELGENARRAVDNSREIVARFMGCDPDHVIFTAGGSEANAIAITRFSEAGKKLYSKVEHPSVVKAMAEWNREAWPVHENGRIKIAGLEDVFNKQDIDFLAAMYVNNELGSINDIQFIADLCNKHNVWLHTDCVQAAGGVVLQAEELGVGSMSISSHKIHGPKGVGALYIRDFRRINPLIYGGQERGIRGGTENVPGIVGFAKACEICMRDFDSNVSKIDGLRRSMIGLLKHYAANTVVEDRLHFNAMLLPHETGKVLNVRIDGVDTQTLLLMLDRNGICASAGSACTSREMHPSHVLKAIGLTDEQVYNSMRLSFSKYNTEEEIDYAAETIINCAGFLLEAGYSQNKM